MGPRRGARKIPRDAKDGNAASCSFNGAAPGGAENLYAQLVSGEGLFSFNGAAPGGAENLVSAQSNRYRDRRFNGAAPGGAENLLNCYPLTSNLASGHLREGAALPGGGELSCFRGLW